MLKTHWRFVSRLERVFDNALIIACFLLSYVCRDYVIAFVQRLGVVVIGEPPELGPLAEYFIVLGVALPLYNALLSLLGGYRSMRFSTLWKLLRITATSSAIVFLCQGSFLYLLKLDISRSFVATFCLLTTVALFLERVLVLVVLRFFRARGQNFRNVLIVGTGQQARRLYTEIVKAPELGVRVVGFVEVEQQEAIGGEEETSKVYDLPARVIADASTYEAALKRHAVDEVLFTDIIGSLSTIHELAEIAVEEGVQVTIAADLFSLEIFQSELSYFGSIPLVHYHPSPGARDSAALGVKRCMDIIISAVALVILSPVLLLVAGLVKLDSPGPVFFRQRRVGKNGRTFVLLKFRSMVENAEDLLSDLRDRNEMSGPVFKITSDPRITRIGKYIRRFSIDELPQLFNVLKGDMSLVGPRPPLPDEVTMYRRKQRRRLSMRPGLTCTWQVSGRNTIPDFDSWAELDLAYVDNWSLWTDCKLLLRTVPAVVFGVGAR